jgi:aspartyl-tRNA(Asn)/glutamyl-tRNA(Gln) amidotransferase subunit C
MENKNYLIRGAMATVSKQEILLLAQMSRLAIHDHELDDLIKHVEDVLNYAHRVTRVARDVDEPSTRPSNVFRADTVVPVEVEPILRQAPEREGNYFVVPRILEHNE